MPGIWWHRFRYRPRPLRISGGEWCRYFLATRKIVRLYFGAELIKVHGRKAPGQRSTDPKDFPPGKAAWALRDVDSVLRRARTYGEKVSQFAQRLLDGPVPWLKLWQAYGLLRLCERYVMVCG